jgi:hypothetical protein
MRVWDINNRRQVLIRTHEYNINWQKGGSSKLETRFKELIFPYWSNQIVLEQLRIPSSLLRIDFLNCNKKLAVEINGPQHGRFNKHFHRNSSANWLASIKRDMKKIAWCEKNGITVLELVEDDLNWFSPKYIQEKFGIDIT